MNVGQILETHLGWACAELGEKINQLIKSHSDMSKKNALINKSWNDEGYWLIKEIEQNFFLIFTLDQTADNNIFQIISIDDCRMELLQLQEPEFKNAKITELKTCL